MKRVAIIQNRLQRGGRLQVMIHIIKLLNQMGITPDVLTFASRISKDDISQGYFSDELHFNIIEVGKDLKMPFEWNILYFNFIINFYLKSYDLIINSNNTSFLLGKKLNMISYVHFPRKARNLSRKLDIHFPEGKDKSIWDYKTDLFKLASFLYRFNTGVSKNETIVANSNFTKDAISAHYSLESSEIEVIYPPIREYLIQTPKKPNTVVSLGRFSPDKRQMEQILLAEKLPQYEFHLIGFVNNQAYFDQCKAYINEKKVANVKLHANISHNSLQEILSYSEYFLHNLRNEPFGITTVQGIANGCIPCVHNSGGQKEIVPINLLRFDSENEAVERFETLLTTTKEEKQNYLSILTKNILKYSQSGFMEQFHLVLKNKL